MSDAIKRRRSKRFETIAAAVMTSILVAVPAYFLITGWTAPVPGPDACGAHRLYRINIYSVATRTPAAIAEGLKASCFHVRVSAFPYTAHVDPSNAGTTYIIPSSKSAAEARVGQGLENEILEVVSKALGPTLGKIHPPDTQSPGIVAGAPGPVAKDVTIYLF